MTVRRARPDDAEDIYRLECACFADPWSLNLVEDLLRDADCIALCAVIDGQVAGAVSIRKVCGEGQLGNLEVAPSFRRQGAAYALMQELIGAARKDKIEKLTLEVREGNLPARRLYDALGFVPVGRRPHFYTAPTEDAILMDLVLEEA